MITRKACMSHGGRATGTSPFPHPLNLRLRKPCSAVPLTTPARSRSTRSRRMSETVEVRGPPVRVVPVPSGRVDHVIVEESRHTRRERSRGGSDEVVVIEEHSPVRRSKSKRKEERESGYRTVDPLAYGGVVGGRKERRGSSGRR